MKTKESTLLAWLLGLLTRCYRHTAAWLAWVLLLLFSTCEVGALALSSVLVTDRLPHSLLLPELVAGTQARRHSLPTIGAP